MQLNDFFYEHPVFTTQEVSDFLNKRGSDSRWTLKALLAHHERQGHIVRLRPGLYATVPPGTDPDHVSVDPFAIASKLADNAVLGYHTALEFHGKAYSSFNRVFFLTTHQIRSCVIGAHTFQPVLVPKALRTKDNSGVFVEKVDRSGVSVSVTSLERTCVDVLDRPDLAGSWEEIWRSLESIEFFDLDTLVEYAVMLDSATTIAKVGYFLHQHREELMVENTHLDRLKRHLPAQPHYMDRSHPGEAQLEKEWNLIVPVSIVERSWEETT